MTNDTSVAYVVLEWRDGRTRIPIAIYQNKEDALAIQDSFRDVEKTPWFPSSAPVALDEPNGAGWWAFSGEYTTVATHTVKMVKHIVEWSVDDPRRCYQFEEHALPVLFRRDAFRETYNGKWYRLHMPWEGR